MTYFIFLGYKITADGGWSHEIKRCLFFGRKAMINLDSILKCRDITFPTKVLRVKALVFPVLTYGCESWTVKKVERQRIDAFKLWCWRRLFESPLDSKETKPVNSKGNQPWIFMGRNDVEAEASILWTPVGKSWLTVKDPGCWEKLRAGGEAGNRGWDWLHSIVRSLDTSLSKLMERRTGKTGMLQSMGSQRVSHNFANVQQQHEGRTSGILKGCVIRYRSVKESLQVFMKFDSQGELVIPKMLKSKKAVGWSMDMEMENSWSVSPLFL